MIITRTIPIATLNIGAFVVELRQTFPIKFVNLHSYRDDGNTGNLELDVTAAWNAGDDVILDALIAGHNPVTPRLTFQEDRYKNYPITVPFATGSNAFQLAFSQTFIADTPWAFELAFFLQLSSASTNQSLEFEIRLNGTPIVTNNIIRMHNSEIRPYSGSVPLQPLLLGNNTIGVYIRNVTGAVLMTLEGGLLTTKRFLI